MVGRIDHQGIVAQISDDAGWSARYALMTITSAGIAVLGLLLSSPAVVIGAMLISPSMDPILGLGFSLAVFDFRETWRSLATLAAGAALAIGVTALIVVASPLKSVTAEILSRTRPNLFDMAVALLAAVAGAYAIIMGRGGTIVGVAIATALMPPLAVVGYGLATWDLPVLAGASALFVTNFVTIALVAAVMARLYGFGHYLSRHQTWIQTSLLILIFVVLATPLGLSLDRIAGEAVMVGKVRGFLAREYGPTSRVTQLDVAFTGPTPAVRAVVIAPRARLKSSGRLSSDLEKALGRPATLQIDQVLMERDANSLAAQKAQLGSLDAAAAARADGDRVAKAVALAAGVPSDAVILDRDHKRALAAFAALPGADMATYRALEQRVQATAPDWSIAIAPPHGPLPLIRFAYDADTLDDDARQAVLTSAWAARRWGEPGLAVPGLRSQTPPPPRRPDLAERRAQAITAILTAQGIKAAPARPAGQGFRLAPSN